MLILFSILTKPTTIRSQTMAFAAVYWPRLSTGVGPGMVVNPVPRRNGNRVLRTLGRCPQLLFFAKWTVILRVRQPSYCYAKAIAYDHSERRGTARRPETLSCGLAPRLCIANLAQRLPVDYPWSRRSAVSRRRERSVRSRSDARRDDPGKGYQTVWFDHPSLPRRAGGDWTLLGPAGAPS